MKTPTEVALERVAKANEQTAKAMNDLTKALEKQNQILLNAFRAMSIYRDVEVAEPAEKSE